MSFDVKKYLESIADCRALVYLTEVRREERRRSQAVYEGLMGDLAKEIVEHRQELMDEAMAGLHGREGKG